jgi:hypothetical protein
VLLGTYRPALPAIAPRSASAPGATR